MTKSILILMVLAGCLAGPWAADAAGETDQDPCVLVHFEPAKASLSQSGKAELRRFFQSYEAGARSRIFVVGYTDASGDKDRNAHLSRQRAEAVRREIISAFGMDPAIVMAQGKGEESPVANNRNPKGRALNRRVEVYLANGHKRAPQRVFGPGDPYRPEIQKLIQEAETMLKQRRLDGVMQKLSAAHALGGDHYSDWHAIWGIAGYYGDAPLEDTRAHLVTALNLDPYNFKAREYISRIEARQKVVRGEISRDMGRSVDAAIGVTAIAQQYEYLSLFEVEPLLHEELENRPVDVWHCMDKQGARVDYYFNHAQVFHWAFALPAAGMKSAPVHGLEAAGFPVRPGKRAHPSGPGPEAALSLEKRPGTIWESKIFK